ncbi:MAG TPA: TonB-dependent receptor [Steroidobacteraceae bacterium]|nr:TonB-dependent receptor [Steroidobacteraceae bacterium]
MPPIMGSDPIQAHRRELFGSRADQRCGAKQEIGEQVINFSRLLRSLALGVVFVDETLAQTTPPQDSGSKRVVYESVFYAQFAPRTALDMVNQTPGFALDGGDDETRGFAGAVGNVLIDGERLGAKSQTLEDVLLRVPASEVLRIEILRGADVAGDASNAAVLANVVRTRTAGGGTWMAGFEMTNQDQPMPTGRLAWSGRTDDREYSIGANTYGHDHNSTGPREVRDGDGTLVARRFGGFPHDSSENAINGQYSQRVGEGKLVVTGQAFYSKFAEEFFLRTTTPDGVQLENELNPFRQTTRSGEAGVTYQAPVAQWDMNLTALATRKRLENSVIAMHFDAGNVQDSEYVQDLRQHSGETIARATFTRLLTRGRLETGAEVAVNTLDGEMDLTLDEGEGPAPVVVPNANLRVKENRGEAFISHAWQINPLWSLDSRLAAEASNLSFTGDTEQSVSLTYVKPRVQLTRKFGQHQLQTRVFRDVGQLDFTDFVSTAALADDIINGGNPDLRPQTAWAAEVEGDLRFAGDSALRVRLFHHWLDEVVDLVPVGTPGVPIDAPGNIGSGTAAGVELSLRLPLKALLPGGSFTLAGTWQDTDVRDPLTGERRDISDFSESNIEAELRQDITQAKLAWGLNFHTQTADFDYRSAEIDSFRQLRQLDVFIESTVITGTKIRLFMQNVLDDTERRDRRFYAPDRNGSLVLRETASFHPEMWWMITISGDF